MTRADCSLAQDWTYGATEDEVSGLAPTLSIYADRSRIRGMLSEDAAAAGLRVSVVGDLAALITGEARPLGDVVMVDCPVADGQTLAALSRLDVRAGRTGTRLIVSTVVDALEDVFGCLDQSGAQILVDPDRADRVIALGHVLAQFPSSRLRELSEDERHLLMRLTEQVGQIAGRIERLAPTDQAAAQALAAVPGSAARSVEAEEGRATRALRPPLPDPRLVRRIIRHRQLRARHFDAQLFADPAWDMLLDLTAARAEHRRVSVTSLCIASGVPPTTALRWIGQMVEQGLFARVGDQTDRRRAFIELSDRCADAMARYFAEIGTTTALV
ncbi:DNA-binding response OmpR family regulator [Novosphingobium chloroacetimidivorans]|uniref:DNA-binding response OmpR family regulator n=1 Tax=Novosphingobium chloroacetimidivorans TaxID=1428314 RepID=A0A7W7NVC0_9SPHN|nr:MarR family transcriptional regulator [Novosphingobium chloroacetimidivorans]MBB4858081.1 DNA-binding response OmpR family regulator [Novosphingobium chloroacetimidivorans]